MTDIASDINSIIFSYLMLMQHQDLITRMFQLTAEGYIYHGDNI